MMDFKAEAEALRDELVARRRDLHRHPELGFQERRTAGIVADELNRLGLEVQPGVGQTGVVGLLEGPEDGPTILYRADMDALPITEENAVEYVSQTPGVMHACGHDGHVSIALGVAKLLAQQRERLHGRVKFVFQPSEEIAAGARAMMSDGVMADPTPDVTLGLHLWNEQPLGQIALRDGAVMSGCSNFTIVVHGRGGHAARPHLTADPVVCAGQLITALHMLVSRRMDVLDGPVVLSIGSVETSSKAHNIIPEQVRLLGTFRSFDQAASERLAGFIRETCGSVSTATGCHVEVEIDFVTIPVVNDPDVAQRARRVFDGMLAVGQALTDLRWMASEDVSLYMEQVPGVFVLVGSANAERGLDYGHHHPRFDFDEEALPLGVALMTALVADYLIDDGE
jgi:amidohydrolase